MFWTEILIQRTLFGSDEYRASSTIIQLIRFAEEAYPTEDCNFHRSVAFLTHAATQNFLLDLLVAKFGSLDAAKIPTMQWLYDLGSFETFARSTRAGVGGSSGLLHTKRRTPAWYVNYCQSDHFQLVKREAAHSWTEYMGGMRCSVNARHTFEVFHHSDYGRLGEADEFRYLVPLCNECHKGITGRGPNVPSAIPEGVKQWL
jgi:hypothetical protein